MTGEKRGAIRGGEGHSLTCRAASADLGFRWKPAFRAYSLWPRLSSETLYAYTHTHTHTQSVITYFECRVRRFLLYSHLTHPHPKAACRASHGHVAMETDIGPNRNSLTVFLCVSCVLV